MAVYHSYAPEAGHGLPHDPLSAIVAPRPIGWISSRNREGGRNLAPYSFFNLINYHPPLVAFASVGRKDTLNNVEATGEFVWNLATRAQAAAMNQTSAARPREVDEFDFAGLAGMASVRVAPDRVVGSPVHFECKTTSIQQLRTLKGKAVETWLVIGEAVTIHIDEGALADGIYQTARTRPITRGGGPADYFEITDEHLFEMRRPD